MPAAEALFRLRRIRPRQVVTRVVFVAIVAGMIAAVALVDLHTILRFHPPHTMSLVLSALLKGLIWLLTLVLLILFILAAIATSAIVTFGPAVAIALIRDRWVDRQLVDRLPDVKVLDVDAVRKMVRALRTEDGLRRVVDDIRRQRLFVAVRKD